MDWGKLFKDKEDVKKTVRGATGQKEPRKYKNTEETERERRIREANEKKNADKDSESDFYDKQWDKKDAKKAALKKLSRGR